MNCRFIFLFAQLLCCSCFAQLVPSKGFVVNDFFYNVNQWVQTEQPYYREKIKDFCDSSFRVSDQFAHEKAEYKGKHYDIDEYLRMLTNLTEKTTISLFDVKEIKLNNCRTEDNPQLKTFYVKINVKGHNVNYFIEDVFYIGNDSKIAYIGDYVSENHKGPCVVPFDINYVSFTFEYFDGTTGLIADSGYVKNVNIISKIKSNKEVGNEEIVINLITPSKQIFNTYNEKVNINKGNQIVNKKLPMSNIVGRWGVEIWCRNTLLQYAEFSVTKKSNMNKEKCFSVSPTKKVLFAPGNLQYCASTNTWRFAEHQYDFVAENNENISPIYNGWIDLFGWGTSGWGKSGAVCNKPTDTKYNNNNYYVGGNKHKDLIEKYAKADWGIYNSDNIINNTDHWQYRTLSSKEWRYLLNERENAKSLVGFACVRTNEQWIYGLVLLPDNWQCMDVTFKPTNLYNNGFIYFVKSDNKEKVVTTNSYSSEEWLQMEGQGAVFLPCSGYRFKTTYNGSSPKMTEDGLYLGEIGGFYWTSSALYNGYANMLSVEYLNRIGPDDSMTRGMGTSVRLVTDVKQ